MGVISRKVLPACGNLCFFCPSLRARSRQPVKRYKKFLAEIFPRSQEAEPNDRKIGKLCDYASKNPLRIPKITEYLEQRFYKHLRNQQFGSVKVVLCIYRKLLSSCKEQMSLFANSLLGIIRTLLEQTDQDEMRILGCVTLVDFIYNQTDSSYMFNLEGFIPKLCQLAQEVGHGERASPFRSAGLQALAFMVWFMGKHSHVSMDFDNIISVTLENYMDLPSLGVNEAEDQSSSPPEARKKVLSTLDLMNFKPELDPKEGISKSPSFWSKMCLQNMARLAKEATTVRRVLEPLFQCFDSDNHWSSEKGLAYSVLTYMQMLLEESGLNAYLLLSILVKHLDHKSIAKQPAKQINILKVTIKIAENAKKGTSGAITGAVADLIKHLRKCMQYSAEAANAINNEKNYYVDLQLAIETCIRQLSMKVGDVGTILDVMAVALESLPANAMIARLTLSSIYRTAEIVSSTPNVSYHQKTFPDALFHQLLGAMSHPDQETRVVAHRAFSLMLMPSLICPWIVKSGSLSIQNDCEDTKCLEESQVSIYSAVKVSFPDQSYSFKRGMVDEDADASTFRLSSHQVSLLLSAIWMQAISAENTPESFEAMAHTYNIALLFTRYKNSGKKTLARFFQLAFSLRGISLDNEVVLQASRKRSLFTVATCMLIFSARAANVPELIPLIKSSLTHVTADPYLKLVEDIRLYAVHIGEGGVYGSKEDDVAALNSLSTIELGDKQLRETVISHLIAKFSDLSEDELLDIRKELLEGFSADDLYPAGAPSYMETSRICSPLAQTGSHLLDEIMDEDGLTDEEAFSEPNNGSQSDRKTSSSINSLDVLNVNQLLESVQETARHVANLPVASTPIPYDQVKNECEALVTGKQQKMSVLQSFKIQQDGKAMVLSQDQEKINSMSNVKIEVSEDWRLIKIDEVVEGGDKQLLSGSLQCSQQESFRLPPSSPYDKFLKAAGC